MTIDLSLLCVGPACSIQEAVHAINRNEKGIVIVVDKERRLVGTITDGDIRRAFLASTDMDLPISEILKQKETSPYRRPITAPLGTPDAELIRLMNRHVIRHIPLLDDEGRVADVAVMGDLIKEQEYPLTAVVMAGGYGVRLRPLTEELPKPMLPVGDRPVMEHIIGQLRTAGIKRINVTTHYRPEAIKDHFGDGTDFGVDIRYVTEESPLGTAGALGLIENPTEPILVINGDILTKIDFRAMGDFHREHYADMTVAVRRYDFRVPYGVLECDGVGIVGVDEKPLYTFFVSAGIYLLEPSIHGYIPNERRYDMTDLIGALIGDGRKVVSFPIMEYWLDIGQLDDYRQAQEDMKNGRI